MVADEELDGAGTGRGESKEIGSSSKEDGVSERQESRHDCLASCDSRRWYGKTWTGSADENRHARRQRRSKRCLPCT